MVAYAVADGLPRCSLSFDSFQEADHFGLRVASGAWGEFSGSHVPKMKFCWQ